jgi:Saccharopine dehydrogenase NADP binding domain
MRDTPFRILIIGASGVFGSRIVELLTPEKDMQLIVAGRTRSKLEDLNKNNESAPEIAIVDRLNIRAEDIIGLRAQLIIDAAGPFRAENTAVIEAALKAGVHYIDLADGRDFVRTIKRFHQSARDADIAILTGASSIPALSHAVIDTLTKNWHSYHTLKIGIFPGNRAPRGLAVVESILSYVGKSVRVFKDGSWQSIPGWGLCHRMHVPFVGTRWASVCDTPEQDLLVERYKPTHSAEFYAGLELSILHIGLWLCSFLVRWRILYSLTPFAKIMLSLAKLVLPFGSDVGGMTITVTGKNAADVPETLTWSLKADTNRGPYIPALAACALARQFRDSKITYRGARACVGILALSDFERYFQALEIEMHTL